MAHSRCCYCRRKFIDEDKLLRKTKDHFIPSSRGGVGDDNILECCQECNSWKSDRMPDFWLRQVEYFEKRKTKHGSYTMFDYRQIIGSVRHFEKHLKGKIISEYRY